MYHVQLSENMPNREHTPPLSSTPNMHALQHPTTTTTWYGRQPTSSWRKLKLILWVHPERATHKHPSTKFLTVDGLVDKNNCFLGLWGVLCPCVCFAHICKWHKPFEGF